jgi:hypothetical protein
MKKLLLLLLAFFALFLSTQYPSRADGVSFGFPLPFPFLFYNFGSSQSYCAQPYYSGYYCRPYYAPRYYRRAYYYGGYYHRYLRPRYYYYGNCGP